MTRATHTAVWLGLLALATALAATNWQSAGLADTGESIATSGFGAFPAIGLAVGFNVLALFTVRYARGLVRSLVLLLVSAISAFALLTPAIAAFATTPILSRLVEAATGVAGWEEQKVQVLNSVEPYSATAFAFSFTACALVLWICAGVFAKTSRAKSAKPTNSPELWVN